MSKKLSRAKFYTKATYSIERGIPTDTLYDMIGEYEITKEEIDIFVATKSKSKAKSEAISQGKDFLEKIYNTLDVIIIKDHPFLVTYRRGDNIEFYEYRNGVYIPIFEQEMIDLIDNKMQQLGLLEHRAVQRRIKDTLSRIASSLAFIKGRRFSDDTKQKWYLNLKNGLLDTKTFELLPHTPEYFTTTQIPFNYDPEAQCPEFLKSIELISNGDKKNISMLNELFGYCLLDGNPKHKVFYLHGTTARNGKSTIGKIISGLIGHGNVATLSLAQIASDNSSILSAIVGKQLNFSDEVSSKYVESPSLTMMSSEGIIEVNPKYKKSFMHQVRCKFIVACNDIPRFKESQGMKHRTVIIPFPYQIPESKRIERYDEILLEKEGSGILNWAIQGAELLKIGGIFTVSDESADDIHESELISNPVLAYLEDNYDFDEKYTTQVHHEEMYGLSDTNSRDATGFRLYCAEKGIGLISFFKFRKELKRFMRETEKIKEDREILENGLNGRRCYIGLKSKKFVYSPYQEVNF
jgi:P4 family phage/plasmid primase-like protien